MYATSKNNNTIRLDLGKRPTNVKLYFTDGPFGSGSHYDNCKGFFNIYSKGVASLCGKNVEIEVYMIRDDATKAEGIIRRDNLEESDLYIGLPDDHSIIIEYQTKLWFLHFNHKIVLGWDFAETNPLGECPLKVVKPEVVLA